MKEERAILDRDTESRSNEMFTKWLFFETVLQEIRTKEKFAGIKAQLKQESKEDKRAVIILEHIKRNHSTAWNKIDNNLSFKDILQFGSATDYLKQLD